MIRGLLSALLPLVLLAGDAVAMTSHDEPKPLWERVEVPSGPPSWGPVAVQPVAPTLVDGVVPRPVGVRVPSIGVASPLVDLAVDGTGALVPPQRFDVAGWYAAGPAPGGRGPAMLAGHVDSRAGTGVFYRLRELRPGDEVFVSRVDGSELRFVVSKTYSTAKETFPTDLVYSPTPVSELRLVTCGGAFDYASRNYYDNVIVEAVLKIS